MKLYHLLVLILIPAIGVSQTTPEPPGGIAREDVPLAVVWGLSAYSGFSLPYSPDAFSEFWKPGLNLSLETDILFKNDFLFGFSLGYSHLPFNETEFWTRLGVDNPDENIALGEDFDIPITQLLVSFKGIENYLLYRYDADWEVGGGFYNLRNTELELTYTSPYGNYRLEQVDILSPGIFAGLGFKYLLGETLQLSVRGRFHHVFQRSQAHQFFDVLIGLTMI